MPRAHRHHLPGCIWHLTHRCHRREFLLKFARDRQAWIRWLFEARKRYGLTVLNYMVTSNHVHLIVEDGEDPSAVARSMQLLAGATGQGFNRRKGRRGAFWEDRYHATAVESGEHLARCMTYVDLNMCRNGVVGHPRGWRWCGYHEMRNPPQRYRVIDLGRVTQLLGVGDARALAEAREAAVESGLAAGAVRDPVWTEAIAVGDRPYLERVARGLGMAARYREVEEGTHGFALREAPAAYMARSEAEMPVLRAENTHFWRIMG